MTSITFFLFLYYIKQIDFMYLAMRLFSNSYSNSSYHVLTSSVICLIINSAKIYKTKIN